jgi:hypothetical protein
MTMESDPSIDEFSIHMPGPPAVLQKYLGAIVEGYEDSEEEF